MFHKILIANRGEIAARIARTCRDMEITAVALYEAADRASLHVRLANQAVELRSPRGFMDKEAVLEAARACGADAIHPGYGFLAESADFIAACEDAGIAFIGPPAEAVARTQCKIDSIAAANRAGFPTPDFSPRSYGPADFAALRDDAGRLGYPLYLKSCAGGRGRGSRLVHSPLGLEDDVRRAQEQTLAVYGDTAIYLEKAIASGHNVAVQIVRDSQGHAVHLGERDGTMQLGNLKLIEESPAPCMSEAGRTKLRQMALEISNLFGCPNAHSVEFTVDGQGRTYFREIKPRIQTDHSLTEALTGIDLVAQQIRIAAGEPLAYTQDDIGLRGWAMQAVITAEDPWNDFLPSPGRLRHVSLPGGPRVRVDTYVYSGCPVPGAYDPVLARLLVGGTSRDECRGRLRRALQDFVLIGIPTNLPYLQRVVEHPDFAAGLYDMSLLEGPLPEDGAGERYYRDLAVAAALAFARRNLFFRPSTPERLTAGWHRSSRRLPE